MSSRDDEFLRRLRATFRVEAAEHLQTIANGLIDLEKTPKSDIQREIISTVFRAAHSLKGAARAVDFIGIESLCQSLEDTFADWRKDAGVLVPGALDVPHRMLNAITSAISAPESPAPARPAVVPARADQPPGPGPLAAGESPASVSEAEPRSPSGEGTVRIAVAKLDARLVEAEEMLAVKLTAGQRVEDLRELAGRFEAWRSEWAAIEPEVNALRQAAGRGGPELARLLEFIDWNREHLKALEGNVAALARGARQDRHVVGKLVDDLLEDSKRLLLLPFGTVAESLPKLVRDLCREQGKDAELIVRGEETEVDKRILEEMKDPLLHLLRNCVDHGIETTETRLRLGKAARAAITLAVSRRNDGKVEIVVSDDGAGIDTGKVKESAIRHNLISAADAHRLDDAAAHRLIFQAEVSASEAVTRLSGRGLGLAIVREKAEKLGGAVAVESSPGRGTRFLIVLPSMLATFRGVLVEEEGRMFVVPMAHVERVARVKAGEAGTVEGRETVTLGGRAVARVRLADVLALPRAARSVSSPAYLTVIVLGAGDQGIAFTVDAVLAEQEVLVKPLGKPLSRVRNVAGATVLGSGRVVPVLNVHDLLKSARLTGGASAPAAAETKPAEGGAVLVAEDSITSRMLLKDILESAGYRVTTAVDGLEAFTLLRTGKFDLVVSDVEMPRLNGFDLTARIRADRKLAELPVVLVTALESREDRERGVDAGANAYIIKSSFDQGDLLDAVRRLA